MSDDRVLTVGRPPVGPEDADFSERAHRVIPGGAHTYSRGDDQLPSSAPRGVVRGKGPRFSGLDGREYVDWGMGIKNVLIGHAEDSIDDAAIATIREGIAFSRPTILEVGLAERLIALFPTMDMVKFCKNGSDANTAAVRLARAITGRDLIAYDAAAPFLSVHDWFIGTTVMRAGVPEAVRKLSVPFTYNDIASVERLFDEHSDRLAAVILEVCRDARPVAGFLETIRRLCDKHGTLLILDEVQTGFCYDLHGAHTMVGIQPDLLSLGKGIANGYPLSALLGKREYMERGGTRGPHERVFLLSTTNGPERASLAASLATVTFYEQFDVVGHFYQTGRTFIDGLAEAAQRHGVEAYITARSDYACRPSLMCLDASGVRSDALRTLFMQELLAHGVFMPWVCISYRHGPLEVEQTLEAFDVGCGTYARALEAGSTEGLLLGPSAKPVFRRFN